MADGRQILEIVMGGSGGAGGGVGAAGEGGGGGSNVLSAVSDKLGISNEQQSTTAKATTGMLKGFGGFVKNQLGISFSLSNILKQSQIFTSFVGSIFQIFGALVDVILAPFLPVLIPVITTIGSWIPWVQVKAQEIANGLFGFFGWLGGKFQDIGRFFGAVNAFMEPVKNVISSIWNSVMEWKNEITLANIYTNVFRAVEHISKWLTGAFDGTWTKFKLWGDNTKKAIDNVPGSIWKYVWIGIKFGIRRIGGFADNIIKGILGAMPGGSILKLLYALSKAISKFFINLGVRLAKVFLRLGKWFITEAVPFLVRGIRTMLGKLLSPIWDLAKSVGSKIPFVGKAFKNLGGLPMMGKALKRVPVLGTVAQLGFGAYETIQATRKYGLQAGMAFGAKNLAAAGAGFGDLVLPGAGTAAAAAIDIGGTIALTKYYEGQLAKKEAEKGVTVNLSVSGGDGRTIQEETFETQASATDSTADYDAALAGFGGNP